MKKIRKKYKAKKDINFIKYWSLLEPKSYVKKMVAQGVTLFKFSSKKRQVLFKAKLMKKDNGFHYLDIPNNFVHSLFDLIDEENISKPPYFSGKKGRDAGAHISVISDEEGKDLEVKEVGEYFNFSIGDFYSVKPEGWKEMERVYFLEVDCPEIKKLRKKYKLPETYLDRGHEFHITIACKEK